ncbi:hypothetical protein HDK77DRAFT_494603 [Phyllosticta capitalensis]
MERPLFAQGFDIEEQGCSGTTTEEPLQWLFRLVDNNSILMGFKHKNYDRATSEIYRWLQDPALPLLYRLTYRIYLCALAIHVPGCDRFSTYHFARVRSLTDYLLQKAELLDPAAKNRVYERMDNMKDHCQQAREYLMEDDSRHLMPLEVRLEVYRAMDSEPRLVRRTPFDMLVLREQENNGNCDASAQDHSTSSHAVNPHALPDSPSERVARIPMRTPFYKHSKNIIRSLSNNSQGLRRLGRTSFTSRKESGALDVAVKLALGLWKIVKALPTMLNYSPGFMRGSI